MPRKRVSYPGRANQIAIEVFVTVAAALVGTDAPDEDVEDDDTLIENQGVTLLIDPLSFQYLAARIDFKETCRDHASLLTIQMPA